MSKTLHLVLFLTAFLNTTLYSQKIKAGDTIENYSFTDVDGKQYEYKEFQHKKIVFSFFRFAGCPLDNFRMHELKAEYSQLTSDGFEVVAVFESTTETLKEYAMNANIPFIVVADPELKLYKKFSVEKSLGKTLKTILKKKSTNERKKGELLYGDKKYKRDGARTRIPADFIVQEGLVLAAHYSSYIGDYLPLYRINQF